MVACDLEGDIAGWLLPRLSCADVADIWTDGDPEVDPVPVAARAAVPPANAAATSNAGKIACLIIENSMSELP
jgi:hypothetical protein